MKVTPMIFNGDVVRAMLREIEEPGSGKRMTRRVVKPQPEYRENESVPGHFGTFFHGWNLDHDCVKASDYQKHCPYGQPGDLIYVRETFVGPLWPMDEEWPDDGYTPKYCRYKADGGGCPEYENAAGDIRSAWTPSIHMHRWASRLTLEITSVRVERLQDISEEDARAEGCSEKQLHNDLMATAYSEFCSLWESIYGEESWDANPWVWVIEYKPMLVNVDEYIKQMEAHGNG